MTKKDFTSFDEMIVDAITSLRERNGSSRQKIVKWIQENYKVGNAIEKNTTNALLAGSKNGKYLRYGDGASSPYKLAPPR